MNMYGKNVGFGILQHWRYLDVTIDANSIPSIIAKPWNLETFVVKGLRGEVILPSSTLKMITLRHLLVKNRASFSLQEILCESFSNSQLNYLKTFSIPHVSYGEDAEMILTKRSNLRKLICLNIPEVGFQQQSSSTSTQVQFPLKTKGIDFAQILTLPSRSFIGNQWEVNDSEFPEFTYLNLDNINILLLSVSDDVFLKLEHLVLTKCK
ncbi:hypothetical protein H5410_026791 [Solanum commersonii]|uniref:Uncharacterized protein n=1 Tax=Solanum commersonii TaxID=4109 RepID=A0A9J5YX54_SOLCO|nr:hypothetical protein H5410_026791 [Solanum commersonii]